MPIVGLIGLFTAAAVAGDRLDIRFQVPTSVSTSAVRLGDFLNISADDPNLVQTLAEIPFGISPTLGHYVPVERADILSVIQARYPQMRSHLRWQGPTRVLLHRVGEKLNPKLIEQRAQEVLTRWLATRYEAFEIQPITGQRYLAELSESSVLEFSLRGANRPRKRMAVWVSIKESDGHERTFPVWYAVTAIQPVWMIDQTIAPGETLSSAYLRRQSTDIAPLHVLPVALDQPLEDLVARMPLRAGTVLLQDQIVRRPEVRSGQTVRIQLHESGIAIQTTGVALQDARLGSTVRIRNTTSGELLLATVTDYGVVEVHP